MEQDWSKEPWRYEEGDKNGEYSLYDVDGLYIESDNPYDGGGFGVSLPKEGTVEERCAFADKANRANVQRIIACVNACAGISTDKLAHFVQGALRVAESQYAQLGMDCPEWIIEAIKSRLLVLNDGI